MGYTFSTNPDFGVWTRAVGRVVDALDLDFWPSVSHVNQVVAELGLTDPDLGDQMNSLEDELMAYYE